MGGSRWIGVVMQQQVRAAANGSMVIAMVLLVALVFVLACGRRRLQTANKDTPLKPGDGLF